LWNKFLKNNTAIGYRKIMQIFKVIDIIRLD